MKGLEDPYFTTAKVDIGWYEALEHYDGRKLNKIDELDLESRAPDANPNPRLRIVKMLQYAAQFTKHVRIEGHINAKNDLDLAVMKIIKKQDN